MYVVVFSVCVRGWKKASLKGGKMRRNMLVCMYLVVFCEWKKASQCGGNRRRNMLVCVCICVFREGSPVCGKKGVWLRFLKHVCQSRRSFVV